MKTKQKYVLVGVAQLDNSINWKKNCSQAKRIISKFSKAKVDLVCFQEAYLSGYHADIVCLLNLWDKNELIKLTT